jgi:hypothetical protein
LCARRRSRQTLRKLPGVDEHEACFRTPTVGAQVRKTRLAIKPSLHSHEEISLSDLHHIEGFPKLCVLNVHAARFLAQSFDMELRAIESTMTLKTSAWKSQPLLRFEPLHHERTKHLQPLRLPRHHQICNKLRRPRQQQSRTHHILHPSVVMQRQMGDPQYRGHFCVPNHRLEWRRRRRWPPSNAHRPFVRIMSTARKCRRLL